MENICRDFIVGEETVHALREVSFTISEGEFVTIMGSSGSGKSTLLNTLGCLDTPTSGEYWLDGISVRTMDKNRRATLRNRKIGFVRLPELQPPAQDHGRGECGAAPDVQYLLLILAAASEGRQRPGGSGSGRPSVAQEQPDVRRTDAEGGHRPGPGQRPGGNPGRRAAATSPSATEG